MAGVREADRSRRSFEKPHSQLAFERPDLGAERRLGEVQPFGGPPEAVLTLPSNTLLFRAEGPQLAVVNAGGQVELRRITLGRDFGATLEVLAGASASDRVVLNPPDALVNGMTVRVATNSSVKPEP